ncbi:MAG: hypothetical protein ACLGPM_10860 [Acidobacteriota bacterium]
MAIAQMSSTHHIQLRSGNKFTSDGLLAQLQGVRVKPRTVLAIDLLLQERIVDLNAVTEVLSGDPGAMACALGMLAEEHCEDAPISMRTVDWISSLDLHELLFELEGHLEFRQEAITLSRIMTQA